MKKPLNHSDKFSSSVSLFRQPPRFWHKRSWLHYALRPFSLVFAALIYVRKFLYKNHILYSYKAPVPVIVVGNIVVGGAGKTPLVIGLTEFLRQHQFHVGIVSRGFGRDIRDGRDVREVHAKSDVSLVGDEPLMLKQNLACPVFVGCHRARAIKALLEAYPETNVILCDDGLQHYRLERDMEIIVTAPAEVINDYLLPAGPLREPISRLNQAHINVIRDDEAAGYHIQPLKWRNLVTNETRDPSYFANCKQALNAVTGIARPASFANTLEKLDINANLAAYPDHFIYSGDEIDPAMITLTTAKDAVKLKNVGHFQNVWVLDIKIKLSDHLASLFMQKIHSLDFYHRIREAK